MEPIKDEPNNSINDDPFGGDPLESLGHVIIENTNGSGETREDSKDDIVSRVDLLIEAKSEPTEEKVDPLLKTETTKSKGKRIYRKRLSKCKDESSSDSDIKREKPENDSAKSNGSAESDDGKSGKSRRSSRKSRPNNFYTNFELDSASGSEKESTIRKKNKADEEYTPVKEKRAKQSKDSTPAKEKKTKVIIVKPKKKLDSQLTEPSPAADVCNVPTGAVKSPPQTPALPVKLNNLSEIKITSVSSMASVNSSPAPTVPMSNVFKENQTEAACSFIKDALTTTAELGSLLNGKATEFVEKKATNNFLTDTRKLQFCMEKAFVLFELARNNLSGIEKKLKTEYAEFMVQNNYAKLLRCDKNTNAFLEKHNIQMVSANFSSKAQTESDSDCEIVEEGCPLPPVRSKGSSLPAQLDILRRMERSGVSWRPSRSHTSGSVSSDGDSVQKVQLPGKRPVWINKDICVKKVKPSKDNLSFFREDGRTLKPPDTTTHLPSNAVSKTALVLGWLDVACRPDGTNFFTVLKQIEKHKRYDSCSDLGESCSEDLDILVPFNRQDMFTAHKQIQRSQKGLPSLLTLSLNKINNIFQYKYFHITDSQKDKFNFHLFDNIEEPVYHCNEVKIEPENTLIHSDDDPQTCPDNHRPKIPDCATENVFLSEKVKSENTSSESAVSTLLNNLPQDCWHKGSPPFSGDNLLTPIYSSSDINKEDSEDPNATARLLQARRYLLQSSSANESDSDIPDNTLKIKRFTKRVKRKDSPLKKVERTSSSSEVFTESWDSDDFKQYRQLKDDPKLQYKCEVLVNPLSADILKPFDDQLREFNSDIGIERLLDFSTLARPKRQSSPKDESQIKKHDNTKKKQQTSNKQNALEPESPNLLDLITSSVTPVDSQVSEPVTHEMGKEKISVEADQPPEDLAQKMQTKSNSWAKDFLVGSSSSELDSLPSSDEDNSMKITTSTDPNKPTKSLTSPPNNNLVKNKKNNEEGENDCKTPVKKVAEMLKPKNIPDKLLSEVAKLLKDDQKKKQNVTSDPRSDFETEENLWLRKKNRLMLSNEKKKLLISSSSSNSEKSCDDSDSNSVSIDSQILQTPTESPMKSSERSTGISSALSTPITPKTQNFLAQSELLSDSNSSDSEDSSSGSSSLSSVHRDTAGKEIHETPSKGRKNIRKVINDDFLMETTKLAAKEEEERLQRLNEKNSQLTELISMLSPRKPDSAGANLVLDFDVDSKSPLVTVHPALLKILKPHQIDGIKFMWDTCFESAQMVITGRPGGGCILAHCMGLGKSLQVVALVHTILTTVLLPLRTVLICCPLSTVLNWTDEFKKWLKKTADSNSIKIFELSKFKKNYERGFHLEDWYKTGGVFIIGYEMFRLLTTMNEGPEFKAHVRAKVHSTLLDPGPDIVVCDEGHLLKNDNTALAKVMNKIRTKRRIVLTGTPLQNNLKEYYCMVNFVKPNLLGSRREYFNRFENPISNGQHRDSSVHDIKIMKKRSHVLHKMLEGSVQRKEASILYNYLPRKQEYVLLVTLSKCQIQLYQHYLENYGRSNKSKGASLLKDFHTLQKIWTHPRTLQYFMIKSREKKLYTDKVKKKKLSYARRMIDGDFVCLEDDDVVQEDVSAEPDDPHWWIAYVTNEMLESLEASPKFTIAFSLLDESVKAGDKMLIFCTSLFTLDALEYFLKKNKGWSLGQSYYRLDGSVPLENRQNWCRQFNSERNKTVKLFLISTRAGGLGINMIAANRVIIMDVSWNPSHDIQSIFRVYRFGQKKDCYIYRLVSLGTMEEKIYERSVTKQAVSCRVVDEQQVDRHYNLADLSELYFFNPIPTGPQPVPSFPSDHVLATVLAATNRIKRKQHNSISGSTSKDVSKTNGDCPDSQELSDKNDSIMDDLTSGGVSNVEDNLTNKEEDSPLPYVWSMHEHDSLLRDLHEEQLDEDDRKLAWLEYEEEREQHYKINMNNNKPPAPNFKQYSAPSNVFPVGQVMTSHSRMIPLYQADAPGRDEDCILPDSGSSMMARRQFPASVLGHSGPSVPANALPFRDPRSLNPGVTFNTQAPKPYTLGRYGPINSAAKTSRPADAFRNIQISNITSNNVNHKKRKKKIPEYFPPDNASTSSTPVMDLTSLPDTPDNDKPAGRRRKRTREQIPKETGRRESPKDKKHKLSKQLTFSDPEFESVLLDDAAEDLEDLPSGVIELD